MRVLGLLLVGVLPWMACHGVGSNKIGSAKDSVTNEDVAVAQQLHNQYLTKTQPILSDTVYRVKCMGKWVEVRFNISSFSSESGRKLLLLLPGWNYSDTQWCTRTQVCVEALKRGYDLMFVEMGKSVYMDSLYPEMRKDYRLHPTRAWLWDSVLQPLQMRGYFTNKGIPETPIKTGNGSVLHRDLRLPIPTYVMGLSTGGRGAMLLALEHPEAFRGVASLSGDYDPTLTRNDNLMINCMGKFEDFPSRWKGSNNISNRIGSLQIPCYVAHGESDKVVSVNQAKSLFAAYQQAIKKKGAAGNGQAIGPLKLSITAGAHDYQFWGEQGLQALEFFEKQSK